MFPANSHSDILERTQWLAIATIGRHLMTALHWYCKAFWRWFRISSRLRSLSDDQFLILCLSPTTHNNYWALLFACHGFIFSGNPALFYGSLRSCFSLCTYKSWMNFTSCLLWWIHFCLSTMTEHYVYSAASPGNSLVLGPCKVLLYVMPRCTVELDWLNPAISQNFVLLLCIWRTKVWRLYSDHSELHISPCVIIAL